MCAIEIQTALNTRPIKFSRSADVLQIRIGIAHGQIQSRDTIIQGFKVKDFFGTTVNIASRMESKVSKVGGFAVYMNNIPKKILDIIREKCRVERVEFRNNCSMSLSEPIARSRRLLMSTICQDAAALHIDDGREHTALSCEIL
jgi:class 3 adenylate cyclase